MGELINLNPKAALTDADIPAAIARDTETAAAIASHVAAADPHPIYLTQTEGDGRYRQSATALTDADIPAAIARDTETAAAIVAHTALADPHPSLWTRITNAFLALTGGQTIIKNNPAMSAVSYSAGQNHLECRTDNGSNPILGFHRAGFSATALYHLGYGENSLRIRNADGFDGAILHDGIATRVAIINSTVPSYAGAPSAVIPFPPGVSADKIVSIDAIAKVAVGTSFAYVAPNGQAWVAGYRYSVQAQTGSANGITIGTAAGTDSQSVLGCAVKIAISYLP